MSKKIDSKEKKETGDVEESGKDKEAMESVEADSMNVFLGGDYADTLEN